MTSPVRVKHQKKSSHFVAYSLHLEAPSIKVDHFEGKASSVSFFPFFGAKKGKKAALK